jgi:hypothetical protein
LNARDMTVEDTDISIEKTVWSGFSLASHHPWAFGLWVLVDLVLGLGPYALIMALLGPNFLDLVRHGQTDTIEQLLTGRALGGLAPLVSGMVLYAILYGAVFRAVLEPEDRRFGYLRLGKREVVLGALMVMFYFGLIALVACALVVAWVINFAVTAVAPAAGALTSLVLMIGLVVAAIWLLARLSMVMPMSFADRRIRIAEAWSLTRGHLKKLVLLAILLVLVGMAIALITFVMVGASVTAFVSSFGDPDAMRAFFEQPTDDIVRDLTPWGLGAAAMSALISTFGFVVFAAPWAEAYRELAAAKGTEEAFA